VQIPEQFNILLMLPYFLVFAQIYKHTLGKHQWKGNLVIYDNSRTCTMYYV